MRGLQHLPCLSLPSALVRVYQRSLSGRYTGSAGLPSIRMLTWSPEVVRLLLLCFLLSRSCSRTLAVFSSRRTDADMQLLEPRPVGIPRTYPRFIHAKLALAKLCPTTVKNSAQKLTRILGGRRFATSGEVGYNNPTKFRRESQISRIKHSHDGKVVGA
jgi:hypothetical protein